MELTKVCVRLAHTGPAGFCKTTWLGLIYASILILMFVYTLRKLLRNNKRAAAGYTYNTVAIDVHLSLLLCVLVWTMVWALYAGLAIGDYTLLLFDSNTSQTEMVSSVISTAILCVLKRARAPAQSC